MRIHHNPGADGTRQEPHVLIVDLSRRYGGADVRVLELAKLLQNRVPFAIAVLDRSPICQRAINAGFPVIPVPYRRGDPRTALFLADIMRRHNIRVVDGHNSQSHLWGNIAAMLAGGVLRCSTVHSLCRLEHRGWKGLAYEQMLKWNGRWSDQVIAVSDAVAEYLLEVGVAQSKVNVVPNAIEVRKEPSRSRELELIRRLGWHSNFLVTSVGRLEEVKGHTYLLSAMKLVLQQCPDARCLIVGDGRLRQQLEVQVVELGLTGYVHLSGFSDDVPQILNATDVMCMPSLSEGLPFAVLEACAHQVPLLVSGVGGMAKLLTHGQTAYVTPPADSDSLARGIEWYFTHPGEATRIARIAHELVLERFSVDAMLACTLEAYRGAHASAPIPPSESLRG